ncbi:MAG: beta-lactamase family protein [Oscillospiraceae bacterium]|nr:beta-lactamase family protein [Oscillospiraceae bacterium]
MKRTFEEKMDTFIEAYCREHLFSGVLRITVKDKVILQRFIGMADHENGVPFRDSSIFSFYSLSKPFCAIGLMKLYDRGLVDIDSHPGRYVPEAAGFHPAVTIRKILHHISGLPDFMQTGDFAEKYAPGTNDKLREHLQILTGYPMMFEPGTCAQYSNINFTVAALIIENVSGMTFREYMAGEVFAPLGMKTAQVDEHGLFVPERVQGYEERDGKLVPVERASDWMFGGGDIIGRVDDVYCLNGAIKHRLLLKEETWQQVLTPSPLDSMGLGCTVTEWHGKKRITHNGGHTGFRTLHIQLPEDDFDVILMSNCGFGDARNQFAEAIHEAYYGGSEPAQVLEMDKGYI